MKFSHGLAIGLLPAGLYLGYLISWNFMPLGRDIHELAGNESAVLVSLEGTDGLAQSFPSTSKNQVSGSRVIIPYTRVRVKPGFSPSSFERIPTAVLYKGSTARQEQKLTLVVDSLDGANVTAQISLSFSVNPGAGGFSSFIQAHHGKAPLMSFPASQEAEASSLATLAIPSFMNMTNEDAGLGGLIVADTLQKLVSRQPLAQVPLNKTSLNQQLTQQVTQRLASYGITINELVIDQFTFEPSVTATLDKVTLAQLALETSAEELQTAETRKRTIQAQTSAFSDPRVAQQSSCLGLVARVMTAVQKASTGQNPSWKGPQQGPESSMFGVPLPSDLARLMCDSLD